MAYRTSLPLHPTETGRKARKEQKKRYKSRPQLRREGLMYSEFFNDRRISPKSNTSVPGLRKRRLKAGILPSYQK